MGDGRLRRGGRLTPHRLSLIELSNGRMVEVVEGDMIVGAFGVRYATLETVGGWQGIGHDQMMEALTGAGLREGHIEVHAPPSPPSSSTRATFYQ